jgi:hypothetical protein
MMNTPRIAEVIGAGVFDTSRGVSPSNWQWGNVRFDKSWEAAAALIHQGWPAEQRVFTDQQAVLLGVIRYSEFVWLYRVYPAGRDEHGRPGRYFFTLVRLLSLDGITHPQVAGLLAYFEKERGLPLNTKPLEGGWPDAEPTSILAQLSRDLQKSSRFGHWGMDGTGRMVRLLDPVSAIMRPGEGQSFTRRRKLFIGVGAVAAGVGAFMSSVISQLDSVKKPVEGISAKSISSPKGTTKTLPKTTGPKPASVPNQTSGDVQVPRESIDSRLELIPKDKPPRDPDPLIEEDDGSQPPNQTPIHSPEPPANPPAIRTDP